MASIRYPVTTLTGRVSAQGDANESRTYAFDCSQVPEVVAGASIVSAIVEYVALDGGPDLALPAAHAVAGVVVGTQVQVNVSPAAACADHKYWFTCTLTLSTGKQPEVAGIYQVASAG